MRRRFIVLLASCAIVLGACGTSTPALTDPREILSKSALALKDVKTYHVQLDLSGKVTADLTGTGSNSQLDLAGTTATLDVDVAAGKFKATGLAPAFLNSGGEVIVADGAAYYKITGPFATTDKYTKIAIPALPIPSTPPAASPSSSLNPQAVIDELNKALDRLPTPPTKGADEKCGDVDCYHVTIHLTAADIAKLSSPEPLPSGMESIDVSVDVYTRKPDLRPAKIALSVNAGAQGSVVVTMTATYDQPVTIAAPPADQVTEGGGLPFPIPSLGP